MKFRGEGAGKGDAYRPVNKKKYDANWDKIFKKGKQDSASLQKRQEENRTDN